MKSQRPPLETVRRCPLMFPEAVRNPASLVMGPERARRLAISLRSLENWRADERIPFEIPARLHSAPRRCRARFPVTPPAPRREQNVGKES